MNIQNSTSKNSSPPDPVGDPLLKTEGVTKHFPVKTGFLADILGTEHVHAVDDVSFTLERGETLAVVGESGCGKSTLARTILQLEQATDGSIQFKGQELTELSDRKIRSLRQDMQMVFQDPKSSLNPRMSVGSIVEEPMKAHDLPYRNATGGADSPGDVDEELVAEETTGTSEFRSERARELLDLVGLSPDSYSRYPHEFSGGQQQRINLARALSTNPDLIIFDEPVSALDVSVQAQVLNKIEEIQERMGLTYLVISHDMGVVRYVADRVAVMYLGYLVELGEAEEVFENPQHPYTEGLLEAIPRPDPRKRGARNSLEGEVPSPEDPPSGCRFRTRCPELIQPGVGELTPEGLPENVARARLDTYEMDDEKWQSTLRFLRAVERREFASEDADRLKGEYFPEGIPGGEPGDVVSEALTLVGEGDTEAAATLLTNTFEENSICALERPEYTVEAEIEGGEHLACCHHCRDQ